MTDALVVHLNRSTHHAIEPASESFETDGPFVVRIQNHGEGSHVHCSLSGDLASTATVTEGNPFLEPDEVVEIPVEVRTDLRPARGTLELSTGYGRESVAVEVLVREPSNVPTSPIEPDRSGSTEPENPGAVGADPSSDPGNELAASLSIDAIADPIRDAMPRRDAGTALLAVLALIAVAIAVGAWQFLGGTAVFLAVLVVIATVFGAAIALVRG